VNDIALFLAVLALMAGIAAVTYAARVGRRT
jgi:hypothetical protein